MALKTGEVVGPVALENLEGHHRVMENYADHRATVTAFLSGRCEATLGQIARLNELARSDEEEDMVVVGVCSNPAESGEELRTFCQRRGVVFPVYRDPDGKIARKFGAKRTPEFFLIDRAGKLVYHGNLPGLELAVRAVLAGEAVTITESPVTGTAIGHSAPKRDIDDPYGTISFSSELVFTQIPGVPVHHCSTIAEAPNGDLLCLWYGGSYESAEDQVLFLARLKKGERFWSKPEVVVRNPDMPPGNAILFKDGRSGIPAGFPGTTDLAKSGKDAASTGAGRLWMVWGRMEGSRPARRGTGWSNCRLMTRISTDSGFTWGEEHEWPDTFGWLPRNPPITLASGELALPMSIDKGKDESGSILLRLNADGKTWTRLGFMPGGEQMTVIQRTNGDLLAFGRNRPYILSSESREGGVTWSQPIQTPLKCPDSAICMIRLKSGRLVLAHNDNDGGDRATLALEQSEDEGKSWGNKKILEMEPNLEAGEYSYPCLIQTSDGMIHITYTCRRYSIKHAAFDEGWLTHLERPN